LFLPKKASCFKVNNRLRTYFTHESYMIVRRLNKGHHQIFAVAIILILKFIINKKAPPKAGLHIIFT